MRANKLALSYLSKHKSLMFPTPPRVIDLTAIPIRVKVLIRFSNALYLLKQMLKKPQKITSKQVAERAGVSQTTVSFVLNQTEAANISEETRQRVLNAVRELNYVPDVMARSLARGRSNNIALVLSKPHRQVFLDEYLPSILTGLNEITQQSGFRILVELVNDPGETNAYERLIHGKEIAGMLVNPNAMTPSDIEQVVTATKAHFPIVALNYVHPEIYSVSVDKLGGTRTVLEHLIKLGHRRIACITYAPPEHLPPRGRLNVYRTTLEAAGLAFEESLVQYGAYDPETGYTAMKSLLATEQFTAVYAMNDVMAFGAITAAHEAGLRVPEDMAIVGFDDIRLARYCTPPLTTVHEPDIEHGRTAGQMLIDLINGIMPAEKHVRLATRLVVRQSCGAHLNRQSSP